MGAGPISPGQSQKEHPQIVAHWSLNCQWIPWRGKADHFRHLAKPANLWRDLGRQITQPAQHKPFGRKPHAHRTTRIAGETKKTKTHFVRGPLTH